MPSHIRGQLSAKANLLPDTDWFVDQLYDWVPESGAGLISANYSRYVVDLNRPSDDAALYEINTPGVIPLKSFSGEPLYQHDLPESEEILTRLETYWQPYHQAIKTELERMKASFGFAILFDAHSIKSRVSGLFEGVLPDLNLGTFDGQSAAPGLIESALKAIKSQNHYSHVLDGRFKGGFITRHYGCPAQQVHALQLEMSQDIYMQSDSCTYDEQAAQRVQEFLKNLLKSLLAWNPNHDRD